MESDVIEPADLFRAVGRSGARALLIGRRALVALGIPVITADYDFWLHAEDVEPFNAALVPLGLEPNRTPAEARARGSYALENGEKVDVMVARSASTTDGERVEFDDVWSRRQTLDDGSGVHVVLPSIEDLIRTKRWSARPHDLDDIRSLLWKAKQPP